MTTSLHWRPTDDYDDEARWLDDRDGGNRWQDWRACDGVDPDLFFPTQPIVETTVIDGRNVDVVVGEEEPAYPPVQVREICHRCPVAGRCLERNMDQPYGIFGGTTAYQRGLTQKKILRKRCMVCGATELVLNSTQKKEACLGCGFSWDVL
jgi:hypothetical protein